MVLFFRQIFIRLVYDSVSRRTVAKLDMDPDPKATRSNLPAVVPSSANQMTGMILTNQELRFNFFFENVIFGRKF